MSHLSDHLTITPKLREDLNTASNWAKIIAVVNFVNAGLNIIGSLKDGSIIGAVFSAAITILINIYLFNFSKKVQAALSSADQIQFNDGLNDLRVYFKATGIILIIAIFIVTLALLIGGVAFLSKLGT